MKNTTERFENAWRKLYNAFYKGKLEVMDCTMCAVGNICDNNQEWDYLGIFYSGDFNHSRKDIAMEVINKTGYSPTELSIVESLFMAPTLESDLETKETQFDGLCAVIEYLAELDNIPNPMDITKMFEYTETNEPKYQLT